MAQELKSKPSLLPPSLTAMKPKSLGLSGFMKLGELSEPPGLASFSVPRLGEFAKLGELTDPNGQANASVPSLGDTTNLEGFMDPEPQEDVTQGFMDPEQGFMEPEPQEDATQEFFPGEELPNASHPSDVSAEDFQEENVTEVQQSVPKWPNMKPPGQLAGQKRPLSLVVPKVASLVAQKPLGNQIKKVDPVVVPLVKKAKFGKPSGPGDEAAEPSSAPGSVANLWAARVSKKKGDFQASPEEVLKSCNPVELGTIAKRVVDLLSAAHEEGEPFLSGSILSKFLVKHEPEIVQSLHTSLRGKGWLRTLLTAIPDISEVSESDDGPCFALKNASEILSGSEKGAGGNALAGQLGKKNMDTLLQEARKIMVATAIEEGVTWIEGTRLGMELRKRHPQLVAKAHVALGKAWVKKLLAESAEFQEEQVQGKAEPCFSMSKHVFLSTFFETELMNNDEGAGDAGSDLGSSLAALASLKQKQAQPEAGNALAKGFGKNRSNPGKSAQEFIAWAQAQAQPAEAVDTSQENSLGGKAGKSGKAAKSGKGSLTSPGKYSFGKDLSAVMGQNQWDLYLGEDDAGASPEAKRLEAANRAAAEIEAKLKQDGGSSKEAVPDSNHVYLPIAKEGKILLVPGGGGKWRVLSVKNVAYRRSKSLEDGTEKYVMHNEMIDGVDEGDGWLRCTLPPSQAKDGKEKKPEEVVSAAEATPEEQWAYATYIAQLHGAGATVEQIQETTGATLEQIAQCIEHVQYMQQVQYMEHVRQLQENGLLEQPREEILAAKIVALCERYELDARSKRAIEEELKKRPETCEQDLDQLDLDLQRARNPTGLLHARLRAMREGTFEARGKGGGKPGGDSFRSGDDWTCSDCGFSNRSFRDRCFKCNAAKPADAGGKKDSGKSDGKGSRYGNADDWSCPGCGTSNWASRSVCFKCGEKKPEQTAGAGGNKDDWTCNACGKNNWVDANFCYNCGAKKIAGEDGSGTSFVRI